MPRPYLRSAGISSFILLLTLQVQAAPATPALPYQPLTLSAAQAQADIALMRRGLETIHPGLYRYRSEAEADASFERLQNSVTGPISDLALWRALALTLAEIHCDHTKPEGSDAIARYRRAQASHLPLRFRIIEGRMVVVSNDGQPGAPPSGSEITAINGKPVPRILATLGQAVAYDGATEQAIAAKLASDGDLDGDNLNEYWPAFYGFPEAWTLDWKQAGDARLSHATLAPINFKRWTELPWPGSPYRAEFYKAVSWKLSGQTAYLRLDTLVNYRNPVDAMGYLGAYFKALKTAGSKHLILDLRENGGGSEDVSIALGRYLLPQRFTWSKPVLLKAIRYGDLPQYIESWGNRDALFNPPEARFSHTADGWWLRLPRPGNEDDSSVLPQDPADDGYHGRLTVLSSPMNASGATRIIAQLKEKAGARIVGEDTSGSAEGPTAGTVFLMTLPNSGLKVRIPLAWNRTNIDSFEPGRGVAASLQVLPTWADALAGRDAALEVAKAETPPAALAGLDAVLAGKWSGSLEYRDYRSDQRIILPTGASFSPAGAGSLQATFVFDDGPGKTVRSSETWRLAADGKSATIDGADQAMTVTELRADPARKTDLTLVAEGSAKDNDVPVRTRSVLTRRGNILTVSRLTQLPGQPYMLRHAYYLTLEK